MASVTAASGVSAKETSVGGSEATGYTVNCRLESSASLRICTIYSAVVCSDGVEEGTVVHKGKHARTVEVPENRDYD